MQCGATAITSQDPAIGEVAGDAAMIVDATDVKQLIEAMLHPQPLREKALARAAMFSWRATARKTREVYDAARRYFGK
jgi:glycosyltransferase involved in cell wall biosynthesis